MTTIEQTTLLAVQKRPKLLSPHGRLGRIPYAMHSIGAVLGAFLFVFFIGSEVRLAGHYAVQLYMLASLLLFYVVLPTFLTILTAKRAHDLNRSGWLAILFLLGSIVIQMLQRALSFLGPAGPSIQIIQILFWLPFLLIPGTRGTNNYGPAPQEVALATKLITIIFLTGAFLAIASLKI